MNWYGIRTLQALGLVWDVKRHKLGLPEQAGKRHPAITPDAAAAVVAKVTVAPVALPSGD